MIRDKLSMVLNLTDALLLLAPLTSSLNGMGGTEGSKWNNSSHRSAFMHRARLSTSFAIGPIVAVTAQGRKDFYYLVDSLISKVNSS